MARSAKLKFPNKWPAFLIGLIKIRTVYWTKMRLVAWVVLVAKGGHKAVAFRGVFLPVAFQVVLLPLAFQVKASHNPDKDSTW